MDVVYIVRAGDNAELRYSLRSLVNLEHDRVWLFGAGPQWYSGERVRVSQSGTKYSNAMRAIEAACLDSRVSDPFILMNDDFFVMEPARAELLDRGPLDAVIAEQTAVTPKAQYLHGMRATRDMLTGRGVTQALSFGLHVPMPIRKTMMLGVLALCRPGLHLRTVYGNLLGEPSRTIKDVKLCRMLDRIPPGPWLSTSDATFANVLPLLHERFPEMSEFEEATMKARVVKQYRDRDVHRSRHVGEEFEVTPERFAAINSTRFGLLIEAADKPVDEVVPDPTPDPAPHPRTVADIKAILDERGIEYRGVTRKADLEALLP